MFIPIIAEKDRSSLEDLLLRLNNEYPGDVGVFAPLLLNYFTLKSGEAIFMGPNSPHAYLYGGNLIHPKKAFIFPADAFFHVVIKVGNLPAKFSCIEAASLNYTGSITTDTN